jgi:uroporphyrinogen-III synthase
MNLQGKTIISTVSGHKSVEIRNIFESLGARVVDFPMTELLAVKKTSHLQRVLQQIRKFQWIIFTSASGVDHFHLLLKDMGEVSKIPDGIKIAAVGLKTAKALESRGNPADFIGSRNTVENLVEDLMDSHSMQNCNILLPLGNMAPDTLERKLSKIASVTRINVYHIAKAEIKDPYPLELIRNNHYDLVLFTSPSGVDNFAEALGPEIENYRVRGASIGDVTAHAVKNHGFLCEITAGTSTYEGLAQEITQYFLTKK